MEERVMKIRSVAAARELVERFLAARSLEAFVREEGVSLFLIKQSFRSKYVRKYLEERKVLREMQKAMRGDEEGAMAVLAGKKEEVAISSQEEALRILEEG